jgi:hypothetical protein
MTRALDIAFGLLFYGMLVCAVALGIAAAITYHAFAPLVKLAGLAILRRGR